jgi:regulator of protease activity HflC (stomatin/prohibitin superfamily)
MQLIVVERKPVSREWTESQATGTSPANQAIEAETRESIGFRTGMNCIAQIDPEDAARYLYRYGDKGLDQVMDQEVRARIEKDFVEQAASYKLDDLLGHKRDVMTAVSTDVIPYFKERGVTITVLGMKGQLDYIDNEIQTTINKRFTAAQDAKAQLDTNQKIVEEAKANAEAGRIMATSAGTAYLNYKARMQSLQNQQAAISKWDGKAPQAVGPGTIFGTPFSRE